MITRTSTHPILSRSARPVVGSLLRSLAALACVCTLTACGGEEAVADPESSTEANGHVHEAPHGGALAVLSSEFANAEIVMRPSVGALDLYLFDGHVHNAARSKQATIELELEVGGESFRAEAHAVASGLSGETVGDTSHFLYEDERLKGVESLQGTLIRVEILGETFENTPFSWPDAGPQ